MRPRHWLSTTLVAACALLMAGCTPQAPTPSAPPSSNSGAPLPAASRTPTVGNTADPRGIDVVSGFNGGPAVVSSRRSAGPALPDGSLPATAAAFVRVPRGLDPYLKPPEDNPLTPEKVALGKMLFFDKRLSGDGTVSCATCHDPRKGWSDRAPVATGVGGRKGVRNAPSIVNATYSKVQFWDGRARTLEEQSRGPIGSPREMASSPERVVATLTRIPGYRSMFERAFHGPPSQERVAQALASFERTVLSGNSAYDRYLAGDKSALTPQAQHGLELFTGKARCIPCHTPPTFSDGLFHNTGVGARATPPDQGRYDVTRQEKDKGSFKTSMLRDLSLSAPYMHDGSQKTLADVVAFYDKGGQKNPHLDPLITRLDLTPQERADLVAFLESLNGHPPPSVTAPPLP